MSKKVIPMQAATTSAAAPIIAAPVAQPADIINLASAKLNEAQLEAATSLEGRHVIIAGPGCGKSRVLCEKAKLIRANFPNDSILMLSFSRKAVAELRTRLEGTNYIDCKTFHGLAYFIIRASGLNFKLDTSDDHEAVIQNLLIKGSHTTVADVLHSLRTVDGAGANKDTLEVRGRYLSWLHDHKLLTFNTLQLAALLILKKHELLRRAFQNRWQWVLCDEYNDVDALQVELLEIISSVSGNLTVAGDDRQQIYRWRGAVPNSLELFAQNATRHELVENYRSNTSVVELCNRLTPNATPLKAASTNIPIPVQFNVYKDADAEAKAIVEEIIKLHSQGTAYKDIAILFRSSTVVTSITSELIRRKIPFFAKSRLFSKYEGDKTWRDLINLLTLAMNQNSATALKPVLPLLYLKQDAIKEIKAIAKKENLSLLDATRHLDRPAFQKDYIEEFAIAIKNTAYMQADLVLAVRNLIRHGYSRHLKNGKLLSIEKMIDEIAEFSSVEVFLGHVEETKKQIAAMRTLAAKSDDSVQVMSIFVSKGLEYNTVFIPGSHCIPDTHHADVNLQEERNILFVGCSRAISRLYISYPKFSDTSIELNQPCPFLKGFFKG